MTDWSESDRASAGKKTSEGAIAQMGERLLCTQEVGGSIPPGSTNPREKRRMYFFNTCILRHEKNTSGTFF